jgi:hypothetical protein
MEEKYNGTGKHRWELGWKQRGLKEYMMVEKGQMESDEMLERRNGFRIWDEGTQWVSKDKGDY